MRTHDEMVREVSEWKNFISSVDNIPFNPNHTYKDENNVYERLTEYVKDWAESVFGYYTTADGELRNLPDEEESKEAKDWFENVKGKLTPLASDWYQSALNGQKIGYRPLPTLKVDNKMTEEDKKRAYDDIRIEVQSTFFPAYRALRDSFSKRSWIQWIFNHRRYVAEREALKVMTNLITSMTGYTQEELDAEYIRHQQDITEEEIANFTIEASNREVHMNEPEESKELFRDEKTQRLEVNVKKRSGETKVVQGERDELLAYGNYDGYFEDVMPTDEVLDTDYDEPIEDNMTAKEKLEKFDDKDNTDELCIKFMKVFKTTEANEDSIWRALRIHLYPELHKAAAFFGTTYDAVAAVNRGEDLKREFDIVAKESANHMFEVAFNALGAEDTREIVKTVKGVEKREKIGGSLFNITTLKDRIVVAQKITDIMLKDRTPIGFYRELSGEEFAKGFNVLENTDKLSAFIREKYPNKYGESEINVAIKSAKNEFGVSFRGEQPITSHVFEIGYRPDPSKIKEEQTALGNAQKMFSKGNEFIKDKAIIDIVTANIEKWKQVRDMQKPNAKFNMDAISKKWAETDAKLADTYKNYDANATENTVTDALQQYKEKKKERLEQVNVDLSEPKAKIVPPVEKKPVEISTLKIEK